ncbi:copper chaperone PCu(A)C [Pseudomonas putida]|uniref:copper chaperone PCu(A)C n=1 Tax=Pseudomonas putida TaxID=303 RepID=UPI003570DA51
MSLQSVKRGLAALVLLSMTGPVLAQTTVSEAWVRASVPHQQSTGAFMTITASGDSKLISVASPVAKTVQVHEMTMNGDVMGMREVKGVALPAGKPVTLDPNGLHVMLMGLNDQVKEGQQVPLTLTVQAADGTTESVAVRAQVRALTAQAPGEHDHMHMDHP